jgi:hypothetical protein
MPRHFCTMVKAQTSLPFAQPAAELLCGASTVEEAARQTASTAWGVGNVLPVSGCDNGWCLKRARVSLLLGSEATAVLLT